MEGFIITSRARSGYSYIAFTKQNTSFDQGLIFMNYYKDGRVQTTRYEGGKTLNLSRKAIPMGKTFEKISDLSGYPLGRFLHDQSLTFMFNQSDFHLKYPLPLWVFVGVNLNSPPNTTDDFEDRFDESYWIYLEYYNNKMKSMPVPELRLESLHVASYLITMLYFVVVLIIAIVYSKYQPLKSRGLIPRIIPIVLFFDLFPDFFRFLPFKAFQFYFIFNYFIKHPMIVSLLILLILRFGRYLLLSYLNERKENAYFMKDKPMKMQLRFTILKHIGRWYSVLAIFCFLFLFVFSFYFIIFLLLFLAGYDTEILGIVHITVILLIMFLNLGVLLFDFIRNALSFKTCYLFTKDNLYFRFEFYIVETISHVIYIFIIIISQILIYVEALFNSSFTMIHISLTISSHSLILNNVLLIVFFTILNMLKSSNKLEKNKMKKLLANQTAKTYFIEYAKTEFALENVSCYYDIKSYQEELDPKRRQNLAYNIVKLYLNGANSELEVNIPLKYLHPALESIQNGDFNDSLFDQILDQVLVNISDTYHRFIISDMYKKLIKVDSLFDDIQ